MIVCLRRHTIEAASKLGLVFRDEAVIAIDGHQLWVVRAEQPWSIVKHQVRRAGRTVRS